MTSTLLLIAGIVCVNFFFLLMIWSSQLTDEVKPKFISSTYDPKATIDFDSMVLKSLNKLISKYFLEPSVIAKHVGDLPTGNNSDSQSFFDLNDLNETYYQFKPGYHSKYFMMFNENKSALRILEMAKSIPPEENDFKHNQIALYTVPSHNFLINYKSDFRLDKSFIRLCWSTKFPGKIQGVAVSNDKTSLAVIYRVIKGNVITYRIRYIGDLACEPHLNSSFATQDDLLYERFHDYIHSYSHREYFTHSEERRNEDKFSPFFFSSESYDDFALSGNTPLTALTARRDAIAFARDLDFNSFYVLKRNESQREWEIAFSGVAINKSETHYYHTNSLKFSPEDGINDMKIIQVYVTINSTSISLKCDIIKANFSHSEMNITQSVLRKIDEELVSTLSYKYDLDSAILQLRKYLKPTTYSYGSIKNYVMELFFGTVCYLGWDDDEAETAYVLSNSNRKVNKIASDFANENIVIKYEEGDFVFMHRRGKSKDYDNSINGEKSIVFNSLPKKYRTKAPISFLIEQFGDRVILFMLMEEGTVLSLNFTKIVEKEKTDRWPYLFNEYNYTLLMIILGNVASLIAYFKIFRGSRTGVEDTQPRADVNQVLQELNRIIQVNNDVNEPIAQGEQVNPPNENANYLQPQQQPPPQEPIPMINPDNSQDANNNPNNLNEVIQPPLNNNQQQGLNGVNVPPQQIPHEEDPLLENIMNEYC